MIPEPGRFVLIEYDDGTTEPLPDLTDDDRDALRQIAEVDWSDVGYATRLARSIEEARRYNAALVKPERRKAVKHDDRPTLFPKEAS